MTPESPFYFRLALLFLGIIGMTILLAVLMDLVDSFRAWWNRKHVTDGRGRRLTRWGG